jgi:hypothetical protein
MRQGKAILLASIPSLCSGIRRDGNIRARINPDQISRATPKIAWRGITHEVPNAK